MKELNEHDLFLESHKMLLDTMKLISGPLILMERGTLVEPHQITQMQYGSIVLTTDNKGIETLHNGLSKETMETVIKTFCESHLRLK